MNYLKVYIIKLKMYCYSKRVVPLFCETWHDKGTECQCEVETKGTECQCEIETKGTECQCEIETEGTEC